MRMINDADDVQRWIMQIQIRWILNISKLGWQKCEKIHVFIIDMHNNQTC